MRMLRVNRIVSGRRQYQSISFIPRSNKQGELNKHSYFAIL